MSVYNDYKSPNFLKFKNKSIFNPLEEIDNKGLNLYEIYKNKKENKIREKYEENTIFLKVLLKN